ncbi:acyltransferase family protein [Sinorhizobium alkalisoli]|uniref:acyltransferase family protein n=1 Tax=Sinorhizobium alkalisoli TaxID=1752398 RepID=UPI00124BFD48|nr:acyltransferase family protein [Sinorhizobium alkalisoli]MCG5481093.1 acyltransferase [Sinorhizobium alkalisoli]
MAARTEPHHFRMDIEGLRALAVSGVIAFHFGVTSVPGGFVGVDIFFVISGYLITRHIHLEIERTGSLDFLRFYARRARRLLPASCFVILATLFFGYFILSPPEQQLYSKESFYASAYMINMWLISWAADYFAPDAFNNPFIHFWSLSIEEQFYLVWPVLLLLFARLRPGRYGLFLPMALVGVISFAFCWRYTAISQPWAFYFAPFRAWEFACGGLASMISKEAAKRFRLTPVFGWTGIGLIVTAYLGMSEDVPFPGLTALVPVAGTVMVLLSGTRPGPAGPQVLLSLPPLQWLGRISYSLYLWHWPVIVYSSILKPELTIFERFLCLALILGLSVFSYRFVENPMRRNPWLLARTSRSLGFAALLTACGAAAAYGSARVANYNIDPQQNLILRSAERDSSARQFDDGCLLNAQQVQPKPCEFGAKNPGKTIVLFGDSHADHWSTPLISIAKSNQWQLVTYLKSSCPAADITIWNSMLMRNYEECDRWRQLAMREIATRKPDMVIISEYSSAYVKNDVNVISAHQIDAATWARGLRRTVDALGSVVTKIAVLRDGPVHKAYLDKCVARALWQKRAPETCDTPRSGAMEETIPDAERKAISDIGNASYVDITDLFCNRTTCPAMIGGKLTFRDRHHIATPFAATLAAPLQRALFGTMNAGTPTN